MDIADWRARIDELDAQLIHLLNRRAECSRAIGSLKQEDGQEVFDARRESALLKELIEHNDGPLDEAQVRRIYEIILAVSREIQGR